MVLRLARCHHPVPGLPRAGGALSLHPVPSPWGQPLALLLAAVTSELRPPEFKILFENKSKQFHWVFIKPPHTWLVSSNNNNNKK